MRQENKNLNLIQVLRGVASLLVVFYHATSNSNEILGKTFIFNFFDFGGAGVDIFFVLSGFIITYTSIQGANQPAKLLPFLRRRAVRIFPTYWIIASLFLGLQLLLPGFYKTHFDFSILNLACTYFLLPGHVMVNGVSWTLTYELFFYLLYSIVFLLPSKQWAFACFVIYGITLILLPLLGYSFENNTGWLGLITFPMNVEFLMGVFAATLISRIPSQLSLPFIIGGSLIFIASGIFYNLDYQLLPNSFNRVVLFGLPSFFIIVGIVKYEVNTNVSIHNLFLSLGEASYSLYLLHLPIIAAFTKIILKLNVTNNLLIQLLLLILIAIICFASILFYKLIEKPLIAKLNLIGKKRFYSAAK